VPRAGAGVAVVRPHHPANRFLLWLSDGVPFRMNAKLKTGESHG